jgi:hypothetical protein
MGTIKELIDEIEENLAIVRKHFLYGDSVNKIALSSLNQDSLAHSNDLEPDTNQQEDLSNLIEAWEWGIDNFPGFLDKKFVTFLSARINPTNYNYRSNTARIKKEDGSFYVLSNPAKLEDEMNRLYQEVNSGQTHPVFLSSQLHLSFLLIHPFEDGNGRTSRLLQNLHLLNENYPPVIINHNEKEEYLKLIQTANEGFSRRQGSQNMFGQRTKEENDFLEFLVKKISFSSKKLVEKISHLNMYEIDFDIKGPNKRICGVKKIISSAIRNRGLYCEIATSVSGNSLELVTCASKAYLEGVMKKAKKSQKYIKGYQISS